MSQGSPSEGVVKRVTLDHYEKILRMRIAESDIPFLGLHESSITESVQNYVAEVVGKTPSLSSYVWYLNQWPALFSIYLTMHVMRGFGEAGHFDVYSHIEEALCIEPIRTNRDRETLWHSFRHACIRLGLETSPRKSGTHYMVDEYLRQAGVPLNFVGRLTEQMLNFTRLAGLPDDDDPEGIRLWQEGLVGRLGPPFSQTAKKALQLDLGGYYIRLLIRLLSGERTLSADSSNVERQILEAIERGGERRKSRQSIAIPQVVLREFEIGVQLPGGEAREWVIEVDGTRRAHQSASEGRFVPVPSERPLPRSISVSDTGGRIQRTQLVWPGDENNRFVVFSVVTGAFKGTSSLGGQLELEPGDYNLILRFLPDGFPGAVDRISEKPSLYKATISLKPSEKLELQRGPATAVLQADAQPLLYWKGTSATSNEGRDIFASFALKLHVLIPDELRDGEGQFILRLVPKGLGEPHDSILSLDETGSAVVDVESVSMQKNWQPGVFRLLVELRRVGQMRTLARSAIFLWNGLARIAGRARFHCTARPTNLDLRLSSNVKEDNSSCVISYHDDNQRFFYTAFSSPDNKAITFGWSVPGIFLYLEELAPDGHVVERALQMGAVVVAGTLSRQQLKVFGDQSGRLKLGTFERSIDFSRVGSFRLPLAGLAAEYLTPTSNTLLFVPDDPPEVEIPLVSLVYPHQPLSFTINQRTDLTSIKFKTAKEIEGLRILPTDVISGQQFEIEIKPNDPAQAPTQLGHVRLFHTTEQGGINVYEVDLRVNSLPQGAWLMRLEAQIERNWGPLCNGRQDHFAVGLLVGRDGHIGSITDVLTQLKPLPPDLHLEILQRAHEALLNCYAIECWHTVKWLDSVWSQIVTRLSEPSVTFLPRLFGLSVARPRQPSSSSWIPLISLLARMPSLLALSREAYSSIDGVRDRLSRTLAAVADFRSVPQEVCKRDFNVAALMSFANAAQVDRNNACPKSFSIENYKRALRACDIREKRGLIDREDWQPGKGDYLGPLHYRYAYKALHDCYIQSLSGNEERRGKALSMILDAIRRVSRLDTHGLPVHLRLGLPFVGSLDDPELGGSDELAQQRENLKNIEILLSLFAQVCRWEARRPGALKKFFSWLQVDDTTRYLILGYLLFIGEDILGFYLQLWELVLTADNDLETK